MAKLTANMVEVLTNAHYSEHDAKREGMTGWLVTRVDIDGRTRNAMHNRGLLHGRHYLTPKGVEERETLMRDMLNDMIAEEIQGEPVEIIGDDPENWEPDFSAPGTRECYYGCGNVVTHVFMDYAGRTEGVCEGHVGCVEGKTYPMPMNAPQTDAESVSECAGTCPVGTGCAHCDAEYGAPVSVVAVVQNTPGMSGATHYHAPGCRDIAREMKRYGQSEGDIIREEFSSVADILAFECGDIASDDAEDGTAEWWESICHNADYSNGWGVKIMPCVADKLRAGMTTGTRPLVVKGGTSYSIGEPLCTGDVLTCPLTACEACDKWRSLSTMATVASLTTGAGFHTVDDDDTDGGFMETDDTREIQAYVIEKARQEFMVNAVVRVKDGSDFPAWSGVVTGHASRLINDIHTGCAVVMQPGGSAQTIPTSELEFNTFSGPWIDPECGCERHANPSDVPCPEHAGKVVSVGTTHHTVTGDGKEWVRFEHVLSDGDMVKILGNGGYGIVHATIPGLPVVYVDKGDGLEPQPYDAKRVIAL